MHAVNNFYNLLQNIGKFLENDNVYRNVRIEMLGRKAILCLPPDPPRRTQPKAGRSSVLGPRTSPYTASQSGSSVGLGISGKDRFSSVLGG